MTITPELNKLTYQINGAAMEVHKILGFGFLEQVYQKALERELFLRKIPFVAQQPIKVEYKETTVGDYQPDFVIADCIIVEIKALEVVNLKQVQAQIINYLVATKKLIGLYFNFGKPSLEYKRLLIPRKFQ